ncbi:hypothetical protein L1887_31063 [Cichorium endivia]|nr:hypothetical protein L1887_31063 [Cichorium endivia]
MEHFRSEREINENGNISDQKEKYPYHFVDDKVKRKEKRQDAVLIVRCESTPDNNDRRPTALNLAVDRRRTTKGSSLNIGKRGEFSGKKKT